MLLAAVLIGVDVTLRKFFNTSIGGADAFGNEIRAFGIEIVERVPIEAEPNDTPSDAAPLVAGEHRACRTESPPERR